MKPLPVHRGGAESVASDGVHLESDTAPSGHRARPLKPLSPAEDKTLVDKCRNGDDDAWAEMHARCQEYLTQQIRYALGDRGQDSNLVDEIAARVWFGLIADDGRLLERFQPQKGNGLKKYLAAIARYEVLRHDRSEFRRRRREHETQVMRAPDKDDQRVREMTLDVNSFLPQLTPREKEFFQHVLMGNDGHDLGISAPNAWQLRHRIRKKLLHFLGMGD